MLAFLAARERGATCAELAWAIGLPYDSRGLYKLLSSYTRWGLILRSRGVDGRIVYRIGDRGRARLAWLRSR